MDLWIRSQDKMNLVKVNQVSLNYSNNKQVIANYIPNFIGKEGEYYEMLGTYETKERALEVLEDIDSFKEYMIMYEHQNYECKDRIRLFLKNKGHRLGTYHMPEE